MSFLFQVDPRPVPHGMHTAGTLLKNLVPRTPFGPSVSLIEGTFKRRRGAVCQKSTPRVKSVSTESLTMKYPTKPLERPNGVMGAYQIAMRVFHWALLPVQ